MLSTYRKKLNSVLEKHKYDAITLAEEEKDLKLQTQDLDDHKKVREIYQQAAIHTQTYLEKHLSLIVTNALQSVFFDCDFEFKVEFDKKRNSTECNLTIIDDGEEYDILEDKGFGVADIASFALRVAYILLDSVDKVLIMDEPFRNLDKERIPYASKMVRELSHKLLIQFIIVSHIEELSECADKSFSVKKHGKFSQITNQIGES